MTLRSAYSWRGGIAAAALLLFPVFAHGDNSKLVSARVEELKSLNRSVLEKIGGLEKYEGKDIYVKVKILPGGREVKVEEVSVGKPGSGTAVDAGKTLYLKGKVEKSVEDSKFKLDLEYVLPDKAEETSAPKEKNDKKEVKQ